MNEKLKKKTNVGALSVRNTKKNLPNCAKKGNKGITLVALIITIIVLLILAVVAIRAVQGDGIISKAKEAQTKYEQEQAKEQAMLENYLGTIEGNIPGGSAPAIIRNGKIPEGATYTVKASNTILEGNNGDSFPAEPATDDTYEEGDYKYTYSSSGWNVRVKDYSKTIYGEIISEIAGKPITSMSQTFAGIDSLTTAPVIPSGVTVLDGTFDGCHSLKTYVGSNDAEGDFSHYVIPNGVMSLGQTFKECYYLTTAPTIPSGVTSMWMTFDGCGSLTTAPAIPDSVTNMSETFKSCTSLKTYVGSADADGDFSHYVIPNSVTNMFYTFAYCTSLTTAPVIPNGVTDMSMTFSGWTSLTTAPAIPDSVTDMWATFSGCTSLTTAPKIPSSVTNMFETFSGCTSLTGTIEINANPTFYPDCLKSTQITGITGSCPEETKAALMATK